VAKKASLNHIPR